MANRGPDRGRVYLGRGGRSNLSLGQSRGGNAGARGGGREGSGRRGQTRTRGAFDTGPQVYRPADGSQPDPDIQADILESQLAPAAGKGPLDLSKLSLSQGTPYRPGYGTHGLPVVLWTNYFEILPKPNALVFRYDVQITPEVQHRRLKARIFELLLTDSILFGLAPGVASDRQANIITTERLSPVQLDVTIRYREIGEQVASPTAKQYRLRLLETGVFAIADLIDYITSSNASAALADKSQFIQALNIIFNNFPKTKDPETVLSTRRNVHFIVQGPSAEGSDLGAGLQAWRGYFSSVRTAANRLLVNVQVKHAAMYAASRLDWLMMTFQRENGEDLSKLARFVRRIRVGRLHLARANGTGRARPKTISGFATPRDGRQLPHPPRVSAPGAAAKQVQFFVGDDAPKPLQSNVYVTVFDFFNKVHKIAANSQLPVVNVGTEADPQYLPPEVCSVLPAQPVVAKLSPNQTAQMIRFAVRRPFENARSITEVGLADIGLAPQNSVLEAFGLHVQSRMLTVKARILPTPMLKYASNTSTQPRLGAWNMGKLLFSKGAVLDRWSVLWIKSRAQFDPWNNDPNALVATLNDFRKTMNDCGMRCSPPFIPGVNVEVDSGNNKLAIEHGFRKLLERKRGERLLLVLLPRRDDGLYNSIKQCGDVIFGIHTVCVIAEKFAKASNVQYFSNVALKVNLKLGGRNQSLPTDRLGLIAQGRTMVVGIDVTHPSPGSEETAPSVAAMVASISSDLGQFPAVFGAQKSRQEMVSNLSSMLKTRLQLWQQYNSKRLPENILVYRDGVSESQYAIVLDKELPLLQKACREIYPPKGKPPAVSIVIVGKRHSTRFYPTSAEESTTDVRSSNPKHGTVVDRGITEPRNWDFYLQAHTALQGTARPAHYFVVHDDIFTRLPIPPGFVNASEVLEDITHNLCYMFGRATKAVSYCPPAYYADMVCERGRCYLSDLFSPTASQAGSILDTSTMPDQSQAVKVHSAIQDSMFYI